MKTRDELEDCSVEQVNVNMCKYFPLRKCICESCDFLDSYGNVRLCGLHPNPLGRFSPRVPKAGIFSRGKR